MNDRKRDPRLLQLFKLVTFSLTLGAGAIVAHRLGVFSPDFRETLHALLTQMGPWAPFVFALVKVVTIIFALPSAPVTFAGGVFFGPFWGTVINVVAATLGASCTFFIGRKLGREAIEQQIKGRLKALDDGLAANGLSFMLFVRLVPLFPFNGINYGAGLTRVSFRDYLLGTFIGIIPGAAVFTYMGHAAAEASPKKLFVAFGLLGFLALIPLFLKGRGRPSAPAVIAPMSKDGRPVH